MIIIDSIQMLDNLGLVVHAEKSVFIPQPKLIFLRFVIDSVTMIVTLPENKIRKIQELLSFAIHNACFTWIRNIARLISYLLSSLPAVKWGGS